MREFGPLKNLWEGGVRGEGSLRFVKTQHGTMGLRVDWEHQVMGKLHLGRGLRAVGPGTELAELTDDVADIDDEEEHDKQFADVTDSIWRYADADEVYSDLKDQKAICLAGSSDGVYGAMLKSGKVVKFHCDLNGKKDVALGMDYLLWKPVVDIKSENPRGYELIRPAEFVVKFACVLLPLAYGKKLTLYAAIREDYAIFTASGTFL